MRYYLNFYSQSISLNSSSRPSTLLLVFDPTASISALSHVLNVVFNMLRCLKPQNHLQYPQYQRLSGRHPFQSIRKKGSEYVNYC